MTSPLSLPQLLWAPSEMALPPAGCVVMKDSRPYYTIRCFTGVFFIFPCIFYFSLHFLFFLAFFLAFLIQTFWYKKCHELRKKNAQSEKNARKCFYFALYVG